MTRHSSPSWTCICEIYDCRWFSALIPFSPECFRPKVMSVVRAKTRAVSTISPSFIRCRRGHTRASTSGAQRAAAQTVVVFVVLIVLNTHGPMPGWLILVSPLSAQNAVPHILLGQWLPRCPLHEVGEGDRRVCQAAGIDAHRAAHECLHVVTLVPDVGVHGGEYAPVLEPEGQELASGPVAAQHDVVPLGCIPVVLHAEVVLVGIEVRDRGVRGVLTEHVARCCGALVEGVGPVLDPDPSVVPGVPHRGCVARCEDISRAGAQELIDGDAIVDAQPGISGQLVTGGGTNTDYHEIAVDDHTAGGAHSLGGSGADDRRDLRGQA